MNSGKYTYLALEIMDISLLLYAINKIKFINVKEDHLASAGTLA